MALLQRKIFTFLFFFMIYWKEIRCYYSHDCDKKNSSVLLDILNGTDCMDTYYDGKHWCRNASKPFYYRVNGKCESSFEQNWNNYNPGCNIYILGSQEMDSLIMSPRKEPQCFLMPCCQQAKWDEFESYFLIWGMNSVYNMFSCLQIGKDRAAVSCYEAKPMAFAAKLSRLPLIIGRSLSLVCLLTLFFIYTSASKENRTYHDKCFLAICLHLILIFIFKIASIFLRDTIVTAYIIAIGISVLIVTMIFWLFFWCLESLHLSGFFERLLVKCSDPADSEEDFYELEPELKQIVTGDLYKDWKILCPYWRKNSTIKFIRKAKSFLQKRVNFKRRCLFLYGFSLVANGIYFGTTFNYHPLYYSGYANKYARKVFLNDLWLFHRIIDNIILPLITELGIFIILCAISTIMLATTVSSCCLRENDRRDADDDNQRGQNIKCLKHQSLMVFIFTIDLIFYILFACNVYFIAWYVDIITSFQGVALFLVSLRYSERLIGTRKWLIKVFCLEKLCTKGKQKFLIPKEEDVLDDNSIDVTNAYQDLEN